jgi:hypothetical protein
LTHCGTNFLFDGKNSRIYHPDPDLFAECRESDSETGIGSAIIASALSKSPCRKQGL